jgi:serine/threonine protein kinase
MATLPCPTCSKELPLDVCLCPACGAILPPAAEKPTEPEPPLAKPSRPDSHPDRPSSYPATRIPTPELRAPTPFPATDSPRFSAGMMLADRYRIIAALGKGGMGEVYRAEDVVLGQPVALKFLPENLAQDADLLKRFRKEVRIAQQVTHPNVCRVHDIGVVEGQSFLTMEYIDGEDLAALLKKVGRLPQDKGLELARQLCQGLAAAHDKGVIHRDLKPCNILIDAQGHVHIADFGLAIFEEDVHLTVPHAGTPAYMAPEQLAGEEVSVQSDLFALGLILYELFTGKRAFQARSREELARLHAEGTPVKPSNHVTGIDPEVERVILRCLEKDAKDRPSSALEVAAALTGTDPLVPTKTPSRLDHSELEHGLVFISYGRENEDLVLPLVSLLRASGQKVFVSVQNLEYGADRKAQVAEAVRRSKRFLLFWSKSSQVSPFVREECELALTASRCSLVPVFLDQTPLPPELERFHGTADLAPLFQTLRKRKLMRRLLWLSWVGLAVMLAIAMPMVIVLGPIEDFAFFLLNLVPWLMILVVPVLILRARSLYRSHLLYRKLAKSLGV